MCSNLLKFQSYDSTTWNVYVVQMFDMLTVIYSNSRYWKCQTKFIYGKPETEMLVMVRWLYMMVLILAGGQQWTKPNLQWKNIWLVYFCGCSFRLTVYKVQNISWLIENYMHIDIFLLLIVDWPAFKGNRFCISIYNKRIRSCSSKPTFSKIIYPKFGSIWLNCFHVQFYHIRYQIFYWLLFNLK